jgi:acyl-CoA thioesterase
MSALDASLALEAAGEGRWRAHADPGQTANSGMFGGWTAALLLKSILDDPLAEGSASAITVNYVSRIDPGAALLLRTQRLGAGRSLSTWRAEILVDGKDDIAATASIVLANRRPSDRFTEPGFPDAPAPDARPMFQPPAPFGQHLDTRYVMGAMPFNQPTTRSLSWERLIEGRTWDAAQIVYFSDVGWPRVLALGPAPRPSSTITMSVYIHATSEELAACGADYILADMIGTRIGNATAGSSAHLWSRGGTLLATTEQLCWFR